MKLKKLSENILKSVKSKGFKYIDLPSVIEANHIVQRSGENFRKFIFSFTDQNGSELCLRPDLTIASCLRYIENKLKDKEKIFYSGQAYRKSQNKKDSIIRNQIGFEILGSKDEKNDDKEIINTSLKSLQNIEYSSGTLTIGNVEIFNLLISKLDIPKRWKLRLSRHFWREKYFSDLLKRLETNSDVDPTIVEIDKKRYVKMLKEDLSNVVAGRTINEILKRFDQKIKDPRRPSKGKSVSKIIKNFLKIKCPINKAAIELNKFFKENRINLAVDKKYFPISKNKVSKLNVVFSASFGRQLEYYTGMVFKIDIKSKNSLKNIINGGRYDGLISDLGSRKQTPAVGAAININL
ncbi:ATP phosphoribosyltransferase regulatory subunit [Candidatus Pelagibacter sp.]|nr:ATP phosphoribosyltransferase regulatory subunit [Candidatus Pelagibacter sp.]